MTDRSEKPSAQRSAAARDEREQRGDPDVIPLRPCPKSEVEEDPGPAGQRQEREDEPDEGGVDPEGLRDARADPRDHPLVGARGERAQRHAASSYGALDANRPRADVRVEHEDAVPGLGDVDVRVAAVVDGAEDLDASRLRVSRPRSATPAGTITSRSPTSTLVSRCVSPAGSCTRLRSSSSEPIPSR